MSECPVCGKDNPSCKGDVFVIQEDKLDKLDLVSPKGEHISLKEVLSDYANMLNYKNSMLNYKNMFKQLKKDYLARLEEIACFEQLKRDYNGKLEEIKQLKALTNIAYQKWLNTPLLEDINSREQKKRNADLSHQLLQANKTIQTLEKSLQDRDNFIQELKLFIKQKKPDNNVKSFELETIPEVSTETTIDKKKTSPFPVVSEMTGGLNRKSHIKEPKKLIQPYAYQKERSKNKKIVKNSMITSMTSKRMTKEILKK